MAETKSSKATKEYVALRNFDEYTQGERVWLHDSDRLKGLVEGAYLQPAAEYDQQVSETVQRQMERETGVPAGESGSQSR